MSDPYPAYPKPKYPVLVEPRRTWPTGIESRGNHKHCEKCKSWVNERFFTWCDHCDEEMCIFCSRSHLKQGHKMFWTRSPYPWVKALSPLEEKDLEVCVKINCECPKYAHEDKTGICHLCMMRDTGEKDMKEMAQIYFCLEFLGQEFNPENGMNEVERFLKTFDESASKAIAKVPVTAADVLYTACKRKYGWSWEQTQNIIKDCLESGKIYQISYSAVSRNYGPALVRAEVWDAFQAG